MPESGLCPTCGAERTIGSPAEPLCSACLLALGLPNVQALRSFHAGSLTEYLQIVNVVADGPRARVYLAQWRLPDDGFAVLKRLHVAPASDPDGEAQVLRLTSWITRMSRRCSTSAGTRRDVPIRSPNTCPGRRFPTTATGPTSSSVSAWSCFVRPPTLAARDSFSFLGPLALLGATGTESLPHRQIPAFNHVPPAIRRSATDASRSA